MTEPLLPDGTVEGSVERHSVGRNLRDMMSSQLVTWTIATVLAFIVTRVLGPTALGELRLAGSLWLIAGTVTGLGTSRYLQLAVARDRSEGLGSVPAVLVLRTIAFSVCAVVLASYVWLASNGDRFVTIVVLLGVSSLLATWAETFSSAFIGLEHMSVAALAAAAGKLVNFLLVVAVLAAGAGVVGVVGVGVATAVGGLVYMVWKYRGVAPLTIRTSRTELSDVFRNSTTFMAAGVALVLYQQIDLVVISWVADNEDLGWYGAADTLFGSLLFPATVIMAVIFPTMGRLHTTDPDELRTLVVRAFAVLSIVAVPVGLGTTLVAHDFAPLLYGEDFRETGAVLAVLGPVIILTFGTILFGSIALATERGRLWVIVMFSAAALTVPLDLLLVPAAERRWDNGAIGGALAYVVTEALQFVIGIAVIAPFLLSRVVLWRFVRIAAAGMVLLAVGWPLRSQPLPLTIAAAGAGYVAAVVAFRVLGDEEWTLIHRATGRFRR